MTIESLKAVLRHPDPPQLWYQLQEIVGSRVYLQHGVEVREGDVVIDVGANVGVAAAFFAEECGAGVVHSFEPVPAIFEVLRENLRGFPACVPHPEGIGASAGSAEITFYPRAWAISSMYADPESDRATLRRVLLNQGVSEAEAEARLEGWFEPEVVACEIRTLSEVLETASVERVDLLKIDAERAELDVLAGIAEPDWPRIRQVVAELHLDPGARAETAETLRARGYEVTVTQDPRMAGTPVHMLYAVGDSSP